MILGGAFWGELLPMNVIENRKAAIRQKER